jgi:RNA polymerase sigma-70 factor (ECF subfamily)
MSDTDHDLIERCRQGDMKAFEVIVDTYQKPVFNAAYRITGSRDDAADITQSVFLKLLQNLNSYNPAHKLFSWLYRIAVNESLNFVRKAKRSVPLDHVRVQSGDHPAHQAELAERKDVLQKALGRLKPEHRAVLVLKHLQGFSYEEIAGALDIPEKLVKSRLFSARQMLRRELTALGVGR